MRYIVNALKDIEGLPETELIVTTSNGYQFNPEINAELDTEIFEKNVLNAKSDTELSLYHDCIELYKGDFLEGIEEEWVITDRGYYRSILTQICHTLAVEYMKIDNLQAAIDVCEKGLDADEFEETLIYTYLEALVKDKRFNYAKKYYNEISKKYEKRVGISLDSYNTSKSFAQLINNQVMENADSKISDAVFSMSDTSSVGPMVVDQKIFDALCVYELRNVARYNYKDKDYVIQMVLETTKSEQDSIMTTFMNVLKMSFRKTDVVTKIDDQKIALLVKLANASDVEILYTRIQRRLSEQVNECKYNLSYEMKQVC